MEQALAVITSDHAWLYHSAEYENGRNTSGIEDEVFAGWAVRILEKESQKRYVKVETHYGYTGYVDRRELRSVTEEELRLRQDREQFCRIGISEADLLDQPKVQGMPLELLLKNSIVELLEREVTEGWCKIRTAAGREGFLHTQNLKMRMDHDGYLLERSPGKRKFFQNWNYLYRPDLASDTAYVAMTEERLRERLAASACEYLGTQYRWGGKSSQGIDCSGLVFMSYLDQGILIYRDARIHEDYPVRRIAAENLKKGDLLYFPGHVAMYLGAGKYIHATGYARTPYVTINSLRASDPDYRADLAEKITGYGSIF